LSSSSSPPRFIRRVNDSISGVLDKLGSEDGKFWCECDDMHCDQQVLLTLREYAALRARGNERLLSPTHQPIATVAQNALPRTPHFDQKGQRDAMSTITIERRTPESGRA